LLIIGLAVISWFSGRLRAIILGKGLAASATLGGTSGAGAASEVAASARPRLHSLPRYHGWYVALWLAVPALIFAALWASLSPSLITSAVMASPAAQGLPVDAFQQSAILAEAQSIASGQLDAGFNPQSAALVAPYKTALQYYGLIGAIITLLLAFAGGAFGYTRLKADFRARTRVERIIMLALLLASLIAILTTMGIVASLLFESVRFFGMVSPIDFLFGTQWNPQSGSVDPDTYGAIPLFWGTILIGAIIAMLVAIPFGLMSAIYLTQYATARARSIMKPLLEILAGVPTVVYGYFAALTVAPALRNFAASIGIPGASSENALAAGIVMGIMIIPFVSSVADDAIAAVPQSMRDGSLAMGATTSETIRQVLMPAALPGVVGGVLLAVSRAIGETMIVVMAAGLSANLTANPFASVTTVTAQIVKLLTGDTEFESAKTLAAFALGLVLFLITLMLNIVALRIVKKYREAYD
jgi:phosphate transport system permease protein